MLVISIVIAVCFGHLFLESEFAATELRPVPDPLPTARLLRGGQK